MDSYTSGVIRAPIGGDSAVKEPFGSVLERNMELALQLTDLLLGIDGRISGRADGRITDGALAGLASPAAKPLEAMAWEARSALERAMETAKRIATDVGALG